MYGIHEFKGETWGDLGDGCWLSKKMIVAMQASNQGTYETPDGKFEWNVRSDNEIFRLFNTDSEEAYTLYREELAEILDLGDL